MAYKTIFSRSFTKNDQKNLGYGAFVGCIIIAFSICTVFKPALNPIPHLNLKVSVLMTEEIIKSRQNDSETEKLQPILEPKSTVVETDEFEQKPNISQPNSIHIVTEVKKTIPMIVEIHTKEKKQVLNVSDIKSTDIQVKKINLIQTVTNPSSKVIKTEDFKKISFLPDDRRINVRKEKIDPICNFSMPRSDVCEMKGDIRIDGISATAYLTFPKTTSLPEKNSWKIKPYARKHDKPAMEGVREFELKMVNSYQEIVPRCSHNHSVPGIVFSTKGFLGNHFHDFTDAIIPLYLTSREFDGEVKFLVTNEKIWWINKYRQIFQKLSKYEFINIDKESEAHCFPKMILGLKSHKELDIDPSRSQHSMGSFREFLREVYSLENQKAIKLKSRKQNSTAPRLLIVSRKRTRVFLNEAEITKMAKNMGFEVVVTEADSNEGEFAKIVNSCDVMMGVHGAGLTNILYLPEKAVFIQILALGNMNWFARLDFGDPSKNMNLRYLEYQISVNESSLIQQYPIDHPVFRDPRSVAKEWQAYQEIYLKKQNVKLDVKRFRRTLQQALKLLHQ